MAQGADLAAGDVDRVHVEELDIGERPAVELADHLLGIGALDLIAVELAHHRLAHRARRRAVVLLDADVVAAGRGVELDPVRGRGAADEHQLVDIEMEQNAVADDEAVIAAGHELLGAVDRKVREAVDREIGEQLERVGAFDEEVDHVVRLVEQHAGLAPGALLVAPVGELRRHHRIDIGAELRIAQHGDGIAGGLQRFFEILVRHDVLFPR
ncbi:MAG: hypothetical protein WDN08_06365 [Rhizomicrobium sp.]